MNRGLIWGGVAFAAAYFAEQQFEHMRKDLARYDKLRAMSDKPPFLRELAGMVTGFVGAFGSQAGDAAGGFMQGIIGDLVRYARIRGM